jgi:hypothetical protein
MVALSAVFGTAQCALAVGACSRRDLDDAGLQSPSDVTQAAERADAIHDAGAVFTAKIGQSFG